MKYNNIVKNGGNGLKPKISVESQLEHLRLSGIQFERISFEDSINWLTNYNYFFRAKSYCKNYDKNLEGLYVNVDFLDIIQMSQLDVEFRYSLIKLTSEIEQLMKVKLINSVTKNIKEDGYQMVQNFKKNYPKIETRIIAMSSGSAMSNLIDKYSNRFAIWNYVEVLTFGELIKLYKYYYYHYYDSSSISNVVHIPLYLRNSCAHNNTLLNTLKTPYDIYKFNHLTNKVEVNNLNTNSQLVTFVSKIKTISIESRKRNFKNPMIHDLVGIIYLITQLSPTQQYANKILHPFHQNMKNIVYQNIDHYEKNTLIISRFVFINKVLDYAIQHRL